MRKKHRAETLFFAENNPSLLIIDVGLLWLLTLAVGYVQMRRGLMSVFDLLAAISLMSVSVVLVWFGTRQQIFFTSNSFYWVMGIFQKRVFYTNIRSISVVDLGGEQLLFTFELNKPHYSPVRDVSMPRANCQEILQLLACQAPQAGMSELATQWRNGHE